MNGLDARKQDVGPIDPPEPNLTENEIEAAVEDRLDDLFNEGMDPATRAFQAWAAESLETVTGLLIDLEQGRERATDYLYQLVAKHRNQFVDYAKNAPEWDHIRREVEES